MHVVKLLKPAQHTRGFQGTEIPCIYVALFAEIAILSLYLASLRAVNAATGQLLSTRRRFSSASS